MSPPYKEIKAGIVSRSGNKSFRFFESDLWNSSPDAFLNLKLFDIEDGSVK